MTSRMSTLHFVTYRIVSAKAMKVTVFCFLFTILIPISVMAIDFGYIFQVDYYGLTDPTTFYKSERMRFTFVPEITGKSKSNIVNFRFNSTLFFQPVGEPELIDSERIIREAYIGLHFNILDIYFGQKFVNWGKIDVLSPINTINHSDNTVLSLDNYFEASLPDLLGQARVHISDFFNIEIVYVPFFHPNIDPIEETVADQEFTISLPTIKTQHFDIDAAFVNKEIGPFEEPAHSLHISTNFFSDLFDLSIYYSTT